MSSVVLIPRFLLVFLLNLHFPLGSHGNFNLFVDKEEFHRITGGTLSQVYLVRDGVVNEYALGYVMTIPFHIHYLDFKWQATGKKPVHYELLIEFSDFFALLQPSANVSKVGRIPHRLDTIRINLPCSGRLTTEVPIIIRFTFHIKHQNKHNVTQVDVKRNKICLAKEGVATPPQKKKGNNKEDTNINKKTKEGVMDTDDTDIQVPSSPVIPPSVDNQSGPSLMVPNSSSGGNTSPPSLLLAGLLGACAVTASVFSVIFFICLKKRLDGLEGRNMSGMSEGKGFGIPLGGSSSSSTGSGGTTTRIEGLYYRKELYDDKNGSPVGILTNRYNHQLNGSFIGTTSKGSDVSPYAYASVVHPHHTHNPGNNPFNHTYANQQILMNLQQQNNSNTSTFTPRLTLNPFLDFDNFGGSIVTNNFNANTLRSEASTTASVVQVDGFQVHRGVLKSQQNGGVKERFL